MKLYCKICISLQPDSNQQCISKWVITFTAVQALIWFQVFLSKAIPMLCLAEIHDSTSTYTVTANCYS